MYKISTVSIAKLIEAHMDKDEYKFVSYANFISEQLLKHGFVECSQSIKESVNGNYIAIPGEFIVNPVAGLIVSHVSQNEELFIENVNKIIDRYEKLCEDRKAKIIRCRLDGSYKDMPKVVTLD